MVSVILIVDSYGNFNGISFVYSVRGFLVMIAMVSVMLVIMIKMTESLWTGRRGISGLTPGSSSLSLSPCLPINFHFLFVCLSLKVIFSF